MPNRVTAAEVCDTTTADSSNAAGQQKNEKPAQARLMLKYNWYWLFLHFNKIIYGKSSKAEKG